MLLFLFSLSNVLQAYAIDRTRKAIHSLMKLCPDKALTRRDGETVLLPIEELAVGDVVIVHLLRAHAAFPIRVPEIKGGLPRWRLQRVLEFIEEHLNDNVSLSELSQAAGSLSCYHFARLFKQSTGYSPYQYFTRRRIRRAQSMLRNQKLLSLGEIAFECGFRDQSTFSRVFRKVVGFTPKAYRGT